MFDWVLNTPLHFLTHPMENTKRFADISLEQEFQGKPKQGKPKHILLFFVMELIGSVRYETFAILTNKIHTFCKTYVINICLFQFFDYLWINRKPEAYSQPRQTSKIQLFPKIVLRGFQLLTIYDFSNKRHLGCMAGF